MSFLNIPPETVNPEEDEGHDRSHSTTGFENILPASISRMDRSLSPIPGLDSSVTESLLFDFARSRSESPKIPERRDSKVSAPEANVELFTPISGWAHFSLVAKQRDALRLEVKERELAAARADASLASLRRLAFRLAANICVKEKRIERLKQSLQEGEQRTRQTLQILETASRLTRQYASPNLKTRKRSKKKRLSKTASSHPLGHEGLQSGPQDTTQANDLTGLWDYVGLPYSGDYMHVFDEQMEHARCEIEQALIACRDRVEALQSECLRSKQKAKTLQNSQKAANEEMDGYRLRIISLEKHKADSDSTIRSVRSQLFEAQKSENELKSQLDKKSEALKELEETKAAGSDEIGFLHKSHAELDETLLERQNIISTLETSINELEDEATLLKKKINESEERQICDHDGSRSRLEGIAGNKRDAVSILEQKVASLEGQIQKYTEKIKSLRTEGSLLRDGLKTSENLRKQAENELEVVRRESLSYQGAGDEAGKEFENNEYVGKLEQSVGSLEQQLKETSDKLHSANQEAEFLRDDLKASEELRKEAEAALAKVRNHSADIETLENKLAVAKDAIKHLQLELERTQLVKAAQEQTLRKTQEKLQKETENKDRTEAELKVLTTFHENLRTDLHRNHEKLAGAHQSMSKLEEEIKELRHEKSSLKMELEDMTKVTETLRGDLGTHGDRSASLEKTILDLREEVKRLEASQSNLQTEVNRANEAQDSLQGAYKTVRQELQEAKNATESLQASLNYAQDSKAKIEQELQTAISQLKESEKENMSLKQGVRVAEGSMSELREQIRTVQNELDRSRKENSSLRERITETQRANSELYMDVQSSKNEVLAMEVAMDELRKELESAEQEKSDLQREVQRLGQLNDEAKQSLQALLELEKRAAIESEKEEQANLEQIAVLTWSIVELQDQLEEARDSEDRRKYLLSEFQDRLIQSNKSENELQERIIQMERAKKGVDEHLKHVLAAKAEALARSEAIEKEYKNKVATLETSLTKAQEELHTSQSCASDMRKELHELRTCKAEMGGRLQELSTHNDRIETDLHHAQTRLAETGSETKIATAKFQKAESKIETLQQKCKNYVVREEEMGQRLAATEAQLKAVKESNERLSGFLEKMERDVGIAEEAAQVSETRLVELVKESEGKLAALEEIKGEYKNRLSTQVKELDTLRNENASLRSKLEEQSAHLSTLESKEQRLLSSLSGKDAEIAGLSASRTEFVQSLKELEEEVNTLRKDKHALEEVLVRLRAETQQLQSLSEESKPAGQHVRGIKRDSVVQPYGEGEQEETDDRMEGEGVVVAGPGKPLSRKHDLEGIPPPQKQHAVLQKRAPTTPSSSATPSFLTAQSTPGTTATTTPPEEPRTPRTSQPFRPPSSSSSSRVSPTHSLPLLEERRSQETQAEAPDDVPVPHSPSPPRSPKPHPRPTRFYSSLSNPQPPPSSGSASQLPTTTTTTTQTAPYGPQQSTTSTGTSIASVSTRSSIFGSRHTLRRPSTRRTSAGGGWGGMRRLFGLGGGERRERGSR